MPTANTEECFREFVGQKVVGVLFGGFPQRTGTKTLIFEDGRGLTINSNGAYWVERKEDVDRAIERKQSELNRAKKEIAGVLELAGAR